MEHILVGVISAVITAFVTIHQFGEKHKAKYITKERKQWRADIREKLEEVSYTKDAKILQKFLAFLYVRLNPNDPEDKEIVKLVETMIGD
ncbi:hypothetical protein SH601_01270 [Gracilibacillus sp. S3-1-1]|uniref:Uncharacterized protein n=1 Tax=Gracilibacillus pellucidus TaxID=3095368 RepID=A0ACC6M0Y3_9BACI|nr:hypothetical protein [Gracilibacillus sp. S3-1-1]MDX8044604.1 hypothetical protein [Gracilibacillus sp. S3-1-1]